MRNFGKPYNFRDNRCALNLDCICTFNPVQKHIFIASCLLHTILLCIFSGDSACHIAEKVMRSLNECFGGGTSVPINYQAESSLLDDIQELTKDELKRVQEEKAEKAAIKCAQAVSQRCNGKPCMKTSIHSRLPFFQDHLNFFVDEEYMMKCCVNASSANIEKCAGSA